MYVVFCLLMGYAAGALNPSYIIARIKGFDIRGSGSGNAGGSNALITMGKGIGAFCILFDIGKAYGVVKLACLVFPEGHLAFAAASVGAVYGHIFPPYMRFKGGKGLACLGGAILAFDPIVFLIMLGCEFIILFATNYICFVPLTASAAFPVVYGVMTGDIAGALVLVLITAVIVYKHVENLRRIRKGTEMRFSYLWNKDAERDRIVENSRKGSSD
ncbi:MAG: glycerol-3-phosphate acyltransferase [Clostridia bacterium]|nr:glycerol-3-phosphate acyltransferase [Clostridia bacterium]